MPQDVHNCAMKLIAQGKDQSSAWAICNSQLGGSNFASYELDSQGDLFLKYFFADSSMTSLPSANGHFSLDGGSLSGHDNEAIGLPFSILPSRDLSPNLDYHPWHSDMGNASYDQHVEYARKFSPGKIVAITPFTDNKESDAQDVLSHNGRFAIVQITDANTRNAYLKNPDLIPKSVSPGFINGESPNKTNIKDFRWAHLAAVPQGAYGQKARLYASCVGKDDKCTNKLMSASAIEKAVNSYCPIGASEKLSSLDTSEQNSSIMSDNSGTTTVATSAPTSTATTTTATVPTNQQGALSTAPASVAPLRLKTQAGVTPQANNNPLTATTNAISFEEFDKVKKQLEEIQTKQAEEARIEGLKALVPKEIFIMPNSKFDQKSFDSDINKLVKAGFDPANADHAAYIQEHYKNKAELLKYTMSTTNPLGGSSYQTPTEATSTPEGAGTVDIVAQKTKGLFHMLHMEVE